MASEQRDSDKESQQFGDFTLLSKIGEGSSAEVFLAIQNSLGVKVALKRWRRPLADADRTAFLQECQLQQQLSTHPNIVRIRWAEAKPGQPPWLATDVYEMSLQQRLQDPDPIPLADAFRWADEILAGLAAVHQADHVHRDVKTANVLLADGVAALGDLGISMRVDAATSHAASGTAGFVAPELANNGVPTFRSDVYSAAVTLRALFGDQAPEAVEALLTRATSHDPDDRPADAGEFRHKLAALRPAEIGARTPPSRALPAPVGASHERGSASSPSRPVRRQRRRMLVIPSIAVICAGIVLAGIAVLPSGLLGSAGGGVAAPPTDTSSPTPTLISTRTTPVNPSASAPQSPVTKQPDPTNHPSATSEPASDPSPSRPPISPTKRSRRPTPTPSITTERPPKTTSPKPKAPKTYVEVPLSTDSSVQATLYFGQLKPLVAAMSRRIDPGLSRDVIDRWDSLCVGTVVFSGLDGERGVVYAEQLGGGWTSVEDAPTDRVSGDRSVRQQFVVPPDGAAKGHVWRARAALEQDGGLSARSSQYTLHLTGTQSSQLAWLVNRSDVVCDDS